MLMPLLSIVIPVYNAEDYLSACLDSVLAQKFTEYELILVNDGSSDSSGDICERYGQKDGRVRVIHQENRGQAAARNRGIEAAQGTYIGFCDNDDFLHPDMYKTLLANTKLLNVDISACSYNVKNVQGGLSHDIHTGEMYCFANKEGMAEYLSRERMDIYVWTKIYNRQFLNSHNIRFEPGRNDEDFLFNHDAFRCAAGSVFMDKALYTYAERAASECRVYYKKDLRGYLHNTLYRTYKIESVTCKEYPELLVLAKRQTIRYNIMMIGRVVGAGYSACQPYFSYIMRYQRRNKQQVMAERKYWGMSVSGVWLMLNLSPRVYYLYRHWVGRLRR